VPISPTQARKILAESRSDLLNGFITKSGKPFPAFLVMDANGKITFDFPPRDDEPATEATPAIPIVSNTLREHGECKPLFEAATKDVFRKNAFRITGLSVDATAREVGKHADKLKMLAELGQDPHSATAALPIKPPPSLDEIREAIQKLKDPEKRLVDEFFWFWPEEFGKSQSDPAIQALTRGDLSSAIDIWSGREKSGNDGVVAAHNLALVFHVRALDSENALIKSDGTGESRQKIGDFWQGAFKRWERLATDDAFWEKVTGRIRQLNEPNLPTGFARRMRATLPEALDKINAELAVEFALAGKMGYAKVHIQFMRETNQGLDNVEQTAELVLTPARNRLKEQIRRAKDRADKNPRDSANAARDLLEQARHTLQLFDLFFDKDADVRNELFDEVAALCNQLPVAYQKATGDNLPCLEILRAVLPFATSMELRQQIEKNISTLTGNLMFKKLEPVYALLKQIQDSKEHPYARFDKFKFDVVKVLNAFAAELPNESITELYDSSAIVLREISLEAWNKHQSRSLAIDTNQLAIKYAVSPDLRQRLQKDAADLRSLPPPSKTEALGKSIGEKLGRAGCLSVIAFVVLLGIIGSCNSTTSSPSSNSYTPPPALSAPPTFGSDDSGVKTYRVRSSMSGTLNREKAEIESERATLEALEARVEKMGREIENDQLYLDRTSQFAIDQFNEKVERYNTMNQQAKRANSAFNSKVERYNSKLQQNSR
jgi:hypothetical protein